MRSCGCKRIIDELEEEKEDIYDALLLARYLLSQYCRYHEIELSMIDRVIERYRDDISA